MTIGGHTITDPMHIEAINRLRRQRRCAWLGWIASILERIFCYLPFFGKHIYPEQNVKFAIAFILTGLCIALPNYSQAAVVYDNHTVNFNSGLPDRSSATFLHTTSGADRLLIVVLGGVYNVYRTVTGITYGAVNLTQAVARNHDAGVPKMITEIWYLVNPPLGPNTVAVTYSGALRYDSITAISFTGVNQSNPIGAAAANDANSGTDFTVGITTTATNSLIVGGIHGNGGDTFPFAPGSGTTERWDLQTGTRTVQDGGFAGGEEPAPSAGLYAFNFTASVSDHWTAVAVEVNAATFTDVTTSAAVGNSGTAYGITWEDYDNDGHLDLWIGGDGQLYKNNGDGTFSVSAEAPTGLRGGNWVDADNGGYMDLFASLDGSFYDNDGDGTFTERAVVANLVGNNLGTSAAIDYNTDGYIDFFFQNGNISPGNEIRENDGDGTFTTIDGDTIGLGSGQSNGETCVVADVDNDGDIDIWYNDASDGSLYYNNGDGTFTEDAAGAGVSINMGAEQPYYAPVFGDYNNDGWLDLFLGHPSGFGSRLYLNDGDGTFSLAGNADLGHARGAAWGDYDNDGDLDLLVGIDGGNNMLFRNNGGGSWTNVAASLGIQNGTAATKSVSFADYDNDGDLDIYFANNSQANVLYRNNLDDSNYLKVKVVGLGSGYSPKDGIGTRIELWNSDMSTLLAIREVSGGEGYGNFPSRIQHFGLPSGWGGGDGTYVVRAKFSSGIVVTQQGVVPTGESIVVGSTTLNQTIEIVEANTVSLGDHAAGQEYNKFAGTCVVSGAELFAFQLVNNINRTPVVDKIQIQLSSVTGISNTDFANLELYVDDNGDGTIDGSDTTGTVGGTGVVDAGVTTITFDANFSIPGSATVNYILKGDVTNLVAGDTVTIDLGPSDVLFTSGAVGIGGSQATSVTHTAVASVLSFTNIAASAGVANTNSSTTGSVAFSDADNDGYVDVLFNGPNAGDPRLYLNNGDNTFAASSTFTALTFDRSIVFGDFSNDGRRDVAFTYFTKLHRNDTVPTFTDVTASSTLANANPEGAGWLDYDGDGWLDLVHPDGNSGSTNLWRNNGNGTFSDRSASAGLPTSGLGNGEWVLVGDYNTDGNTDIFYERGGATGSLYLFRNNGDGTFADITPTSGLGSAVGIDYRAGFCLGDYDNDGDFDLFVSQVGANNTLYRNNGNDTFSNVTATSGDINTVVANSYGCSVGDFDNDGDVDIFVTNNGAVDHLFRNNGDDTFTEIGASVGLGNNSGDKDFTGVALADIDNDGDLDAFVNNRGGSSAVLYRNDLNNTNYLRVRVIGNGSGGSPKDGTGTVVFLFNADGSELLGVRQVDGGRPMGQDEPIVHFGLPCSHGGGAGTYTVKALFTGGTYATSGQIVPFDESITIGSTTLSQTIEIDEGTSTTAVKLIGFTATATGNDVKVSWQTAHEINNMGFYLYRADTQDGPFTLLTDKLIPGADFITLGQTYEYIDTDVTRGKLYYYRLVDVDTSGKQTNHGPICVDWDADGLPDDWEIAHGLDPTINDADLDADNDGLTNLEEYERGSDPNNPDSDGDGIIDGDEHFQYGPSDPGGSLSLSRGVHILASDETGITLELRTEAFETATVEVGAGQFEKLSIKEYVHGYTTEVGKPRLPLKGIMLDIPAGQSAQLTVLDTVSTIGYGYQVYPVPQNYADDQSYDMQVAELFTLDADAYGQDTFYPESVVGLGEVYHFRDQLQQQLIFYPLSFNPVSGQIRHYNRIRVRIDYEDADLARVPNDSLLPWAPPSANQLLPNPLSMGPTAMAFIGPAFLNSPIISAIASLGTLAQAAWMPPGFDWATQGPAYKILVADPGVYHLTGSYLAASGVDLTGVNIGQVRLYNLGTEIALTVYDENGDNGFDGNDYIEFYATAVASGYAKYTNHNVYWLTLAGGLGAPLRMGGVDGSPAAGPNTDTHDFTVHYEPDQGYWQEAPGADSLDRWFIGAIALGDQIDSPSAGQPVTFDLPLVDVDDTETGTLKISLYGGYDTDHEVAVSYEGQDLGTFAWSGYRDHEVTIEDVDFSEQTNDGKYTVAVTCLSGFDKIAFDWIAATYPRKFVAADDRLQFTHASGYLYTIDDFSTDELMVLDITAADDPMRVQGFDIFEPIASTFSLEFETADDGQAHTYLVIAETEVNTTAAAVVEDSGSDLAETTSGADYILITHDDIGWDGSGQPQPWVDDLVALRQAQGLRVKLVNVQDIYDEFSYGLVTPEAIKDFLTYAYENWSVPAPQYVLLVGDSSYDYKDNWGLGTTNYVPAYLTYTEFMGETVTDEWFVTIDGDDAAADMYIGRLPATSAAEAQVMVDKIIAYETGQNTKTWEKNTLLVADDQEEAFESVFKTMNEDAAALLPTDMVQPYKGYLQDYLDAGFSPLDLNSDILDQINAGALIANFSGHGHLQGWADESIFDVGDINGLTNAGKYPFIVSMNCLTGYFAYPEAWTASFAELLLRAEEKGTAAALMPTGMTTTEGQHVMNTALFETIFVEDIRKLGPAIARAKRELLANGDAYFEQVSQTFLLFGDPAMQLRVPLPRRPSGLVPALWTKSGVALRWEAATDCNNDPAAGYNVYRSTSPTGNFTKINQAAITEPEFTDDTASASAAASSQIYYYTVTAVDADGDESSPSAMAASPSLVTGTGSSSGGVGCFINAAAKPFELAIIRTLAIYWVLIVGGLMLPFLNPKRA